MQIIVRCLGQSRCLDVTPDQELESLYERISNEFGLDATVSLFSGVELVSCSSQLSPLSTYDAKVSLLGGGKKKSGKKKKAYTTVKKNKHKHKKDKLRVIERYYAIDKNGNVSNLLKLCINPTCVGKGIFLAAHYNRYHCGKCGSTYQRQVVAPEKKKAAKDTKTKGDDKKEEAVAEKGKKAKKGK